MNLIEQILFIYPTLQHGNDFLVENISWKDTVKWITTKQKQPTALELKNAWVELLRLRKLADIKIQKAVDISKLATLSDQLNLLAVNLNTVVDILIKTNPTLAKDVNVVSWKKILAWIQAILAK